MTLTEEFKSAFQNSNVSALEMSWSLGITLERFNDLLKGAQYNRDEEMEMLRFVFKEKSKAKKILSENGISEKMKS